MGDNDGLEMRVPPLPPRYRLKDVILGDHAEDDRVRVEYFINENSFKERLQVYFVKNQRSSLRIRIFNLVIKLLSCVLYIVRVLMDHDPKLNCFNRNDTSICGRECSQQKCAMQTTTEVIDWTCIFWVERHVGLWGIQVTVAVISLAETLLVTYLGYKGNILQQILSLNFLLELVNSIPFIVTIFYAPLRQLFVPVFLNCWLAKIALDNMLNDLHRAMQKSQSALAQQLIILTATVICLVFTSVCGIQHLQRGSCMEFDLFDSLWFVIVTFSTVGYGDIHPDIWPSKLFMMLLIGAAFIVLPTQFEQLAYTWMERQKMGGNYSSHRAQNEKHVVVVATVLQADIIMDFLNEFYAHPKLQDYFVVLLSPSELDSTMKLILQVPIWAARVIYIQGSALKDTDLSRCRVQDAEACFMTAARNYTDKTAADQHTILRSWAVKDFAPQCPQCVQIFRPESKLHVRFAEHVVCEDEFKYALLANNCLCPGVSTLMTLLLHTSRGAEGQTSSENWMRLYGKCSGNEIYHIRLGDSRFFGEYKGKSFTYASFHAHRKYGVSLVGIKQDMVGATIQLNPGPRHIMKPTDLCFYMSITKEENSAFILAHPNEDKDGIFSRHGSIKALARVHSHRYTKVTSIITTVGSGSVETRPCTRPLPMMELQAPSSGTGAGSNALNVPECNTARRPSIELVPADGCANITQQQMETGIASEESSISDVEECLSSATCNSSPHEPDYTCGFPTVTPYIGTNPTLCHLMREKRPLCCLQLVEPCQHCGFKQAQDYTWPNRSIIVAADFASNGLYNFIVPLRSHARPKSSLSPIVLLLEIRPDQSFLETICYFPLVYWMIGSIESLDDLLRAGINLADNIVVVNKESSNAGDEDTLADCNTILAVQTIFRLFPSANIITELSQASNMRFMQFRAKDHYALQLSKLEKREKERGSHLYYMFRLPFAAGNVFSASMLDTLLYQAFVKDYLITFVRLLLGVDQAAGSGHLSCMKLTSDDMWIHTYGRLYQKLGSTTCEIPIGIYRTQKQLSTDVSSILLSVPLFDDIDCCDGTTIERKEIEQMVKCRMASLGLPSEEYDDDACDNRDTISYVITNPSYDVQLEENDIIYLIKPSSLSPQLSRLMNETTRKRRRRKRDIVIAPIAKPENEVPSDADTFHDDTTLMNNS